MNWARPALVLSALLAAPAAHAADSTLDINYDLSAGVFTLGKVAVHQNFDAKGYQANETLETGGIVNLFWKSKIDAQANGAMTGGRPHPVLYDSHSVNHNDKLQQVSLSFNGSGPPTLTANPPYKANKYPVSDEQKKDALDPVSAVALVTTGANASAKTPCGTAAPVFDGARRYDIVMDYVKTDNIKTENGLYAGPAFVCQIHYKQIAGFKQKILAEGSKLPDIFAWVASLPDRNNPSQHYLVPVKVWATTSFGTISATASNVKIDGVSIKPKGKSS